MSVVKRVVLDILKPHQPNVLEFAATVAEQGDYRVNVTVAAVDEKTENVVAVIEGGSIDFELVSAVIGTMGASVHSIDEVTVIGSSIGPT